MANGSDPRNRTAKSIFRVGLKVEVSFEEADFHGVWFPATVVEELANNLFVVEYQCPGINNEPELRTVTVDHLHIRPLTPPVRDTDFFLLEKVDAFYDFGWWTGVITKKLADSRYIVYFKHTNKEREVGHLELRLHVDYNESNSVNKERATVLLNFTGPIENTIEKESSIVATAMKRTKATNAGSNDKPLKSSKRLKPGITFDDKTISDVAQSKRVSKSTVGQSGQTLDKTEISSRGKRMLIKRGKGIELKSPVITSARLKGRSPATAGSSGGKALPKGEVRKIKTPKIVEKENVVGIVKWKGKELSPAVTCVMGLQCKVVTDLQSQSQTQTKKVKSVVESETLVEDPKLVPDEEKEVNLKRKRGRPAYKFQVKTPLPLNHENGDAVVGKEKKNPEKVAVTNTSTGKVVSNTYKSVTGKRGKRRKIRSINIVTPPPQDSSTKQKANGNRGLEIEAVIDKSVDTISDDQPLSRWFESKKQTETLKSLPPPSPLPLTLTNILSFEKRSTLWATLESMDLFQMVPQKPHFRPLDKEKECTREGQAISKMVTYLRVVESTSQLQLENPRSAFEDNLEALVELESHGFDVKAVRERLSGLLSIKEKTERLEEESKKAKEKVEAERVKVKRIDKEIELVDNQVVALLEKRAVIMKNKEKKDKEVGALEAEVAGINQDLSEVRAKFDDLAAKDFSVSEEQGVTTPA